ncbi:MAG: hypothetical protein NVS4B8_17780 [Herpetosiphon sp.]
MIKQWMPLFTARFGNPRLRLIGLLLVYLAIAAALIVLYGPGDFSTPSFVYQGF